MFMFVLHTHKREETNKTYVAVDVSLKECSTGIEY